MPRFGRGVATLLVGWAAGRMRCALRTAADTTASCWRWRRPTSPARSSRSSTPTRAKKNFEVILGTLRARIGTEERTLAAGDELDIPRGTVHAMWNESQDEARVIWLTRPALRTEDFFVAVGRLAQEGKLTAKGAGNPLLGAALLHRFRDEFRPTRPPPVVQPVVFGALAILAWVLGQRP